jgi:hypothetical protein
MNNSELDINEDETYPMFPMFPTVIYKSQMDREFTDDEIKLTETILADLRGNSFNRSLKDAKVLDRPSYANLKTIFMEDDFSELTL